MNCTCKDYNQCISCIKYNLCEDKPYPRDFSWALVYVMALIVAVLILLIN